MTESAKSIKVSYRTALNYIDKKSESATLMSKLLIRLKVEKVEVGELPLLMKVISILKECKKINAIMELHKDVNEIESEVFRH